MASATTRPELELDFSQHDAGLQQPSHVLTPTKAEQHPYINEPSIPRDILEYLPPSGAPFSLFGDPYAQLVFIKMDRNIIVRSHYWHEDRAKNNNFTDNEIALLGFLSKHRCATSRQLKAILFDGVDNMTPKKMKDFLNKSISKGIIVPFTWQSPCPLDREKPRIYGLSPVAAQLAEQLFNLPYSIPRNYKFLPIRFEKTTNPGIHDIFNFVIANELYCHLKKLDRVLEWHVNKRIYLKNGTDFRPQFSAHIIKDQQDFKIFWVEVIRPTENWYHNTIKRFQAITKALENIEDHNRPERLIIIVDDDSRIPDIANLANEFMPDIVLRFTSDARLLNEWSDQSLVLYDDFAQKLVAAKINFLSSSYTGMTASEYYKSFEEQSLDLMLDQELEDF